MGNKSHISLFSRLALLPGKIRAKGARWALGRTAEELLALLGWVATRLKYYVLTPGLRKIPAFHRAHRGKLYAFYDLDTFPTSFDIGYFIVCADLHRRRRHLRELHIVLVPSKDEMARRFPEGYAKIVDHHSRQWRFRNIVMPICSFLQASQGITACSSRAQADAIFLLAQNHFPETQFLTPRQPGLSAMYRDIVTNLKLGDDYAGLQASEQGLRYIDQWIKFYASNRKLIVITLRQYRVDPQRNNDLDAWISFAHGLDPAVYAPVFVPDTDHAYDDSRARLADFFILDGASWSLEIRMALYQRAYLNMTVNTGPATLCVLSSACRYLMFKITVPDVYLASERVLLEYGFQPGQNPPFTTPFQKWVWEPDQLPVIRREFDAMCRVIEAGTPSGGVARQPTS